MHAMQCQIWWFASVDLSTFGSAFFLWLAGLSGPSWLSEHFCLPSHQEDFGIVVAEAPACGLSEAID